MTLATLLTEQQRLLEGFLATLDEERKCLCDGVIDGARMSAIAETKQATLEEMETIEQARRERQQADGFGSGAQGAERLAKAHGAEDQWYVIRELAAEVRHQNLLNGHIISQRLEYNQRAIDFLNRAVGGSVYGPNGQSQHKGFGGISSKA